MQEIKFTAIKVLLQILLGMIPLISAKKMNHNVSWKKKNMSLLHMYICIKHKTGYGKYRITIFFHIDLHIQYITYIM